MLGTDIALKHQVSEAHFRDLLAEAERQRLVSIALDARPRARRAGISEVRAAVATLLLRAGSWLMPEEQPDACNRPVAFELRPGQ
jgi:hypothetical protein